MIQCHSQSGAAARRSPRLPHAVPAVRHPWLGRASAAILECLTWGGSSAGRASRSQCEGREFDPPPLHQCSKKNRPSRPVFCCPESRVLAGFLAVLPVPRAQGTAPETTPVCLPFPLSSPLTLTNRLRLAPAKLLPWREVTRVSRRAVGVDDWSSNRVERTEGRGHRAAHGMRYRPSFWLVTTSAS